MRDSRAHAGAPTQPALLDLAAGLARERLRGWAIVHAVAWGGEPGGDWYPDMVACAGWLAGAA